jgi:hypothetical protein
MGVTLEIPDVPDDLYARLQARADKAGLSLSRYLSRELPKIADLASMEEALERLKSRSAVELTESPVDIIRAARDSG